MGKIFDALEKTDKLNAKSNFAGKKQFRQESMRQAVSNNFADIVSIPSNADKPVVDSKLVTFLKPHSVEAEQFKVLRTNLLFPEDRKLP